MALTASGFERRTLEAILSGAGASLQASIDPAVDLSPDQPLGQILGIFAADVAEAWEVLEDVHNGQDPDNAEGVVLDARAALTGTVRDPATKTVVVCTVNLNSSTVLSSGVQAAVVNHADQVFVLRDTTSNASASSANVSGTVWEASIAGPTAVNAGTLTQIVTPSTGWNSITNPADGVPGVAAETDTELRIKREEEIFAIGGCTFDSLRADILRLDGIQQTVIFENDTNATNGDGVPAHSFEPVIYDGLTSDVDVSELAATIWAGKPLGIASYGTLSADTTDSLGSTQTVFYTRATAKRVYIAVSVTTESGFEGISAVQSSVVAADSFRIGEDVIALRMRAGALDVAGVVDAPAYAQGFTSSPSSGVNLTIGAREIAYVQTSDVAVTVV